MQHRLILLIALAAALLAFTYSVVLPVRAAPLAQATVVAPQTVMALKDANLRSGPGTTFAIVGSLKASATITVTGQNAVGDWYQLETGQWIFAQLVQVNSPTPTATKTLAPVRIILVPTSTPTPTPMPTRIKPQLDEVEETVVVGALAFYQNMKLFVLIGKSFSQNDPQWENQTLEVINRVDTFGRVFAALDLEGHSDLGYLRNAGISMSAFARGYRLYFSTNNVYHLTYANADLDESFTAMRQGLDVLGLTTEVDARLEEWSKQNEDVFNQE